MIIKKVNEVEIISMILADAENIKGIMRIFEVAIEEAISIIVNCCYIWSNCERLFEYLDDNGLSVVMLENMEEYCIGIIFM